MIFLQLFIQFFKTGLFSIGGGMATIPFLMDMADETGWFTKDQLTDMIAISESTPGPIGVNMSTYAGFTAAGVLGSLVATFSLIFPSVVIIIIVSKFMKRFQNSQIVQDVFYGIRPASAAMIAASMFSVMLAALFNISGFEGGLPWYQSINYIGIALFTVVVLASVFLKKLHPIFLILFGAVIGIVFQL